MRHDYYIGGNYYELRNIPNESGHCSHDGGTPCNVCLSVRKTERRVHRLFERCLQTVVTEQCTKGHDQKEER